MALWQRFLLLWNRLSSRLCVLGRTCINSSWTTILNAATQAAKPTVGERLRQKIYWAENCDLHHILREDSKTSWPERQLKIDEGQKAIEITERFHKNLKKLDISSSIADHVRIIEETFLQYLPAEEKWNSVRKIFQEAREKNDPQLVITGYTMDQDFTRCLNNHLAANSHHFLKLYCTIQNCPILSRTQEYTEAFSAILTHPKLDQYIVGNLTLYRGAVLYDRKLVDSYQIGATILTTTLLSTSLDQSVALAFCDTPFKNSLPVLWIYTIADEHHRSALNVGRLSHFCGESEILLLRYVPFKIRDVKKTNDGRTDIYLTQCSKQRAESNQSASSSHISIQLGDCQNELELTSISRPQSTVYPRGSRNNDRV